MGSTTRDPSPPSAWWRRGCSEVFATQKPTAVSIRHSRNLRRGCERQRVDAPTTRSRSRLHSFGKCSNLAFVSDGKLRDVSLAVSLPCAHAEGYVMGTSHFRAALRDVARTEAESVQ